MYCKYIYIIKDKLNKSLKIEKKKRRKRDSFKVKE